MIETILGRAGLPVLLDLVRGAIGKIDNPVAQTAAKALSETQTALAQGAISPEAVKEANRHLERMDELSSAERSRILSEVNQSLRVEVASPDMYVRRMRPTFGYLMALTWSAQMLALAYVIVFDTSQASTVLNAVESLSAMWAVALSVLGIYVYKRSEEKKMDITSKPYPVAPHIPQR